MEIEHLKLYLHLSESLHFGRTSRECFVSPPTLTRVVQRLEESCGAALFIRDRRMVELTPAGREFQQFARDTLQRWEMLRENLNTGDGVLRGEIRLFCTVTASYTILPELLPGFREHYPEVVVRLTTGDAAEGVDRVLDGRADVSISAMPDIIGERMVAMEFLRTPLIAIAPQGRLKVSLRRLEKCDPAAWQQVSMIFPSEGLLRERVDGWLSALGLSPKVQGTVSGHEAILSMVGLGLGIGVIPKIVLDRSLFRSRVRILKPDKALPDFPVGFYTTKSRLKSQVVSAFWEMLAARMKR